MAITDDRPLIPITVHGESVIEVCFEPSGSTYELAPGGRVYARASLAQVALLAIVYTPGVVTVWLPGVVDVLDHERRLLDTIGG